jgi:hypothetical protein
VYNDAGRLCYSGYRTPALVPGGWISEQTEKCTWLVRGDEGRGYIDAGINLLECVEKGIRFRHHNRIIVLLFLMSVENEGIFIAQT